MIPCKIKYFSLFLIFGVLFSGVSGAATWDDEIVQIIHAARPSVVIVEARAPFNEKLGPLGDIITGQNNKTTRKWYKSMASGVVWDRKGYVVTTASVAKDAKEFTVRLWCGKSYEADLAGLDEESNLAVLECRLPSGGDFPVLEQRLSPLPEGSWIALLGFGVGGTPSVASGMAGVPAEEFDQPRMWFQFVAPVRPGNSGGALIDSDGKLAGIVLGREEDSGFQAIIRRMSHQSPVGNNPSIYGLSHFGIAIPTLDAERVVRQIIDTGCVQRGWAGVGLRRRTCKSAVDHICLSIVRIIPGSPADKAGLKAGDCLLTLNGHPLHSPGTFGQLVTRTAPGETVDIEFIRDGKTEATAMTIEARPGKKSIRKKMIKSRH